LLPAEKDFENCHIWKDYISQSGPRDGAALVLYLSAGLPTSTQKGVKVDYDQRSGTILPYSARDKEVIAWCSIYGSFPFMHDENVKKEQRNNLNATPPFHKRLFTYSFSTASSFRGILSTIMDLHLIGFGFPKLDGKRDLRLETLHAFSLPCFVTQHDWLQKVVSDACGQMVLWLAPISRYSPISNLPFMSKNAATITRSSLAREEGELISNITFVANRQEKGDKVVAWDDDDDEKEEKDKDSSRSESQGDIYPQDDDSEEDGESEERQKLDEIRAEISSYIDHSSSSSSSSARTIEKQDRKRKAYAVPQGYARLVSPPLGEESRQEVETKAVINMQDI